MVTLSRRDWNAIVKFFRTEESVMRDSYSEPGKKDETWMLWLKKVHPKGYKIYDQARKAIASVR